MFFDALRLLEADPGVRCVVLPRYPEEADRLRALGRGRLVVPTRAVDSRSLMAMADLVLGAGGTMTREAALLGSPTLSVFSGRAPAVDRWLVERGLLGRLERADDILPVRCRTNGEADLGASARAECLRAQLVAAVVGAAAAADPLGPAGPRVPGLPEAPRRRQLQPTLNLRFVPRRIARVASRDGEGGHPALEANPLWPGPPIRRRRYGASFDGRHVPRIGATGRAPRPPAGRRRGAERRRGRQDRPAPSQEAPRSRSVMVRRALVAADLVALTLAFVVAELALGPSPGANGQVAPRTSSSCSSRPSPCGC